MAVGKALAAAAMTGMISAAALGCGGNPPAPADQPVSGAKASCNGPDHTDKGHCCASGQKASCGGPDHTDKCHCGAATPPKS
jgi:hypothetical protein